MHPTTASAQPQGPVADLSRSGPGHREPESPMRPGPAERTSSGTVHADSTGKKSGEEKLDDALDDTFPASDPVSPDAGKPDKPAAARTGGGARPVDPPQDGDVEDSANRAQI